MTTKVAANSLILTTTEARMLYHAAKLGDLRTRHRAGDTALYRLLTDITVCAFTDHAAPGTEPRHETASEEREWWTVQRLARATGLSTRKVRLDAQTGRVPATKQAGSWLIASQDAGTYIDIMKGPRS